MLTYWRGLWRLAHGYCPRCNSSPPNPYCRVCEGSHQYGPALTVEQAAKWRTRWEYLNGRLH